MNMKEYHMKNSQLKLACKVQIAYVNGCEIFKARNDIATLILILILNDMNENLCKKYINIISDTAYESQEKYLYL